MLKIWISSISVKISHIFFILSLQTLVYILQYISISTSHILGTPNHLWQVASMLAGGELDSEFLKGRDRSSILLYISVLLIFVPRTCLLLIQHLMLLLHGFEFHVRTCAQDGLPLSTFLASAWVALFTSSRFPTCSLFLPWTIHWHLLIAGISETRVHDAPGNSSTQCWHGFGSPGRQPLVLDTLADAERLEPVKRRAVESDKRFGELDLREEVEKDGPHGSTEETEPGEVLRHMKGCAEGDEDQLFSLARKQGLGLWQDNWDSEGDKIQLFCGREGRRELWHQTHFCPNSTLPTTKSVTLSKLLNMSGPCFLHL